MNYLLTRVRDEAVVSPFCRILRMPRGRVVTAAALDGSVYVRTVGRSPDTLSAEVILDGDAKKAILEESFREGAVMCFSADESTIYGIITEIGYPGKKFAGVRRAEVMLSEVEYG